MKNLFGGNVPSFEAVLDRGRREALLRLREKALAQGANLVINVKLDSISLNPIESQADPLVSICAYGTAVKYVQSR